MQKWFGGGSYRCALVPPLAPQLAAQQTPGRDPAAASTALRALPDSASLGGRAAPHSGAPGHPFFRSFAHIS